ncbi:MAG: tetratricopeptide repeat protein [Nitrospirae bacterium]|nr:MAG: tetratricopeptide repeat protein [Nitrospirota bacterium]
MNSLTLRMASICLVLVAGFAAMAETDAKPSDSDAWSGWEAIKAGKIEEASRHFQEAIARHPNDATLFLGAGLAAHLQRQEERARAALQEALRLDPRLTEASLLLGEIAYGAGDIESAIRTYEAALAWVPEHPQIRDRLETWRKEMALHGTFQRTINPHFTVLFEGPAEQALAARSLEMLEAAYWRIGTTLLAYPAEILTVILYTDEQFRDITRSPKWAAGLYDGKIRVPMRGALNDPGTLEKVLAHEFTHALLRSIVPRRLPVWLDEGLAMLFEIGDTAWAEGVVRQASTLIPLSKLHGSFVQLPSDQVPLAYAESAIAVRMLFDRGGPAALTALLNDLAAEKAFNESFERRFFMTYSDFQTMLERNH